MGKVIKTKSKDNSATLKESPEVRRAIVRIAHKIKSSKSNGHLVKLNGIFFRIKKLG